MSRLSTLAELKETLHRSLAPLGNFEECALLDYPNNLNVGDHLIWLGCVFYLTQVVKTNINYVSSSTDFSGKEMEKRIGKSPILLHGGGNLGDLWSRHQNFRERIISTYRDQPIIIFPQSIYFANPANLKKAADVFNAHPNLTLFARDNSSYELALQHFSHCQVIKAPDMAFHMVQMSGLSLDFSSTSAILYLCRDDLELNQEFSPKTIDVPNLVVDDWVSFDWVLGNPKSQLIQAMAGVVREVWQRGLQTPGEWLHRQKWEQLHPYTPQLNNLYNHSMHRRSWGLMHSAIYQLKPYRLVITNRLHAHILCLLLGIPHIFLPNSYFKNEAFYQTWTSQIPFVRFVKDASQIKETVKELLDLFPTHIESDVSS